MRGVETRIQEIRHRIFREVARMAYHTEWPVDKRIEELPYKIIPGEVGNFRNDVFLERAIVGERLRLAMGLPSRSAAEHAPLSDNIEAADKAETYYTPPLINVIKFACNACKEKRVMVTDSLHGTGFWWWHPHGGYCQTPTGRPFFPLPIHNPPVCPFPLSGIPELLPASRPLPDKK